MMFVLKLLKGMFQQLMPEHWETDVCIVLVLLLVECAVVSHTGWTAIFQLNLGVSLRVWCGGEIRLIIFFYYASLLFILFPLLAKWLLFEW